MAVVILPRNNTFMGVCQSFETLSFYFIKNMSVHLLKSNYPTFIPDGLRVPSPKKDEAVSKVILETLTLTPLIKTKNLKTIEFSFTEDLHQAIDAHQQMTEGHQRRAEACLYVNDSHQRFAEGLHPSIVGLQRSIDGLQWFNVSLQ